MNVINRQPNFNRMKSNNSGKQWVHSNEVIVTSLVSYNVKFLGSVEVDQPKGSDMVRDAIRKMKFNKQIMKAEGRKAPKVELCISINGITVQDPKTKMVQFHYPLHQVSYCADDKSDKKMFTFIAKDKVSDKHNCYVFDSERCAEEITLTLGQAFDLAYKRFLKTSTKTIENKKEINTLAQQVQDLSSENKVLKEKVEVLEDQLELNKLGQDFIIEQLQQQQQQLIQQQRVLEANLSADGSLPLLLPPPPGRSHGSSEQLNAGAAKSGLSPVAIAGSPGGDDLFGMPAFSPTTQEQFQLDPDNDDVDMEESFRRGLDIGTEDFSLDDFDPCKK